MDELHAYKHTWFIDVGDDLDDGQPPVVGFYYNLVLTLSNEIVPRLGIQLPRGVRRCGWIRERDVPYMRSILNRGQKIKGKVISKELFVWNGATCYWGTLEWYTVPQCPAE